MRKIGQIESESKARVLSDYLYVQGIENQVEEESGELWGIWVNAEDQLDRGAELLREYMSDPSHPRFGIAEQQAAELRAHALRSEERYRRKIHSRSETLRNSMVGSPMPLTVALIGITLAVGLLQFLKGDMGVRTLFISSFLPSGQLLDRLAGLTEIRSGQVWRLFTPMFLHFGLLHIVFNMLWMLDLGSAIERREGAAWLLLFILVVAGLSNVAQFVVSGPRFGGMSGVVCGMFGYIWIRGKSDPLSGYFLNPPVVYMMLIWLGVCTIGWVPNVANTVHLVGLGTGMAWGFFAAYFKR